MRSSCLVEDDRFFTGKATSSPSSSAIQGAVSSSTDGDPKRRVWERAEPKANTRDPRRPGCPPFYPTPNSLSIGGNVSMSLLVSPGSFDPPIGWTRGRDAWMDQSERRKPGPLRPDGCASGMVVAEEWNGQGRLQHNTTPRSRSDPHHPACICTTKRPRESTEMDPASTDP